MSHLGSGRKVVAACVSVRSWLEASWCISNALLTKLNGSNDMHIKYEAM